MQPATARRATLSGQCRSAGGGGGSGPHTASCVLLPGNTVRSPAWEQLGRTGAEPPSALGHPAAPAQPCPPPRQHSLGPGLTVALVAPGEGPRGAVHTVEAEREFSWRQRDRPTGHGAAGWAWAPTRIRWTEGSDARVSGSRAGVGGGGSLGGTRGCDLGLRGGSLGAVGRTAVWGGAGRRGGGRGWAGGTSRPHTGPAWSGRLQGRRP